MKQTKIIMKPSWLRKEEQRQQKLQIFTFFTILVLFAMGVNSFQMTPLPFHSTRSYSKISSYSTFSFSFHVKKSMEDDAAKHLMAAISNDDDDDYNDDAAVVDHHATSTTATTLETNGQRQDHDDTSWNSSTSATSTSTETKNNTPSGIAASHSRYGSLLEEVGLLDINGIGGGDGGGVKSLESLPSKRIVSKNEVFCNRELKLGNIRAIGFDMDYTIAQYKQPAFDKLAFDGAKEKLVNKLGYPVKLLDVEYDHTVSVVRTTGVRYGSTVWMDARTLSIIDHSSLPFLF